MASGSNEGEKLLVSAGYIPTFSITRSNSKSRTNTNCRILLLITHENNKSELLKYHDGTEKTTILNKD